MLVSVSVPAGVCKALFACVISPSSIVSHLQVVFDCLALHGIASRLRAGRFASGALRLTNTRLSFALDTGGNPVLASPYVQVGLESSAGGSSCKLLWQQCHWHELWHWGTLWLHGQAGCIRFCTLGRAFTEYEGRTCQLLEVSNLLQHMLLKQTFAKMRKPCAWWLHSLLGRRRSWSRGNICALHALHCPPSPA